MDMFMYNYQKKNWIYKYTNKYNKQNKIHKQIKNVNDFKLFNIL